MLFHEQVGQNQISGYFRSYQYFVSIIFSYSFHSNNIRLLMQQVSYLAKEVYTIFVTNAISCLFKNFNYEPTFPFRVKGGFIMYASGEK